MRRSKALAQPSTTPPLNAGPFTLVHPGQSIVPTDCTGGSAAQVGVRVGGRLLRFEQRRTAAIRCSGVLVMAEQEFARDRLRGAKSGDAGFEVSGLSKLLARRRERGPSGVVLGETAPDRRERPVEGLLAPDSKAAAVGDRAPLLG